MISRQRPQMQTALNIAFELNKGLPKSTLSPQDQELARHRLGAYAKHAERILELEVEVQSLFKDLALQAQAVDPISADLKALASSEVDHAQQRITVASRLSTIAVVLMAVTGLLSALAIGRLIHASVTQRITALTASAAEFRAGNLNMRAEVTGQDELGALASTFNDMAARMRDMVANLEAKVLDRTSELAEARDTLQRMVHELGEKNIALEVLSRTDRLTGIANRRKLEEALQTEVLRARRYGKPFSVIMVDVDHFKNVNDAYGHHTGDLVLNALAAKLALKARETDIVGRWGGEEFLIVCPETETTVGLALAERLRGEFSEGTTAEAGRVTCSFGVASFHLGDDMGTLIARADNALYRAKDNGRNRVEVEEKLA
jgi:diguanylate cyclase (GGDEF)-like protein